MSEQLIAILALVAIFLIGTLRAVNLGALALVATFVVGAAVGMETPEVLAGFPGELFVILVGVTYLFAIAKNNGTVEWLVQAAVSLVGGKVAAIPWVMFTVSCVLVSLGAVSPAAVAIIAPIGMTFAGRYGINPLLMGLMVVHGSAAGNFSPIGVLGVVTNGVVDTSGVAGDPVIVFLANLMFNVLLGVGVYFGFGGRQLIAAGRKARRRSDGADPAPADSHHTTAGQSAATVLVTKPAQTEAGVVRLDRDRIITLAGMVALVLGALVLRLDVGLMSLTAAVLLTLLSPDAAKDAVAQINWGVVLLVCGIVTYVALMQEIGTVDYLGNAISKVDTPLLAALLICYIGAIVSAFASTTGILGALIPLAVPLLATGQVGAIGLVTALSISASVVDSSPFSTNGAIVVANAPKEQQPMVYRQLMKWGFGLVLMAPVASWGALTVLAG
ncbi:SLC13 family permease [Streptomyces sp. NPDC052721]|uniref:SLC13 family permease n=1 Tax=Streptomyces sp. NPDC052721 TaxID=3154955 RepID=UPI003431D0D1